MPKSPPPRPKARRTLKPQRPPAGIYASTYEPEFARWICRKIAAGVSLRSLCRADPSMPTEKTVWNWARRHPEFARWKAEAFAQARAAALARRDAAAGLPVTTPAGVTRRRAWNAGLDGYFLEHMTAARMLDEIAKGRSVEAVCREAWAPSVGTFYNWLKRYPELLAEYRLCKGLLAEMFEEEARELAPWLGDERRSERNLQRRLKAAARRAAQLSAKRYA